MGMKAIMIAPTDHQKVWAKAAATGVGHGRRQLGGGADDAGASRPHFDRGGSEVGDDLSFEHDGEEGGGHRSADQAHDVHDGRGLGDLGVVEVEVGRGGDRHHRQAEPQAANEERDGEQAPRWCWR